MNSEFDILFQTLELSQLFSLMAQLERAIKEKVKIMELPEMEVARIKHNAINSKSVM